MSKELMGNTPGPSFDLRSPEGQYSDDAEGRVVDKSNIFVRKATRPIAKALGFVYIGISQLMSALFSWHLITRLPIRKG